MAPASEKRFRTPEPCLEKSVFWHFWRIGSADGSNIVFIMSKPSRFRGSGFAARCSELGKTCAFRSSPELHHAAHLAGRPGAVFSCGGYNLPVRRVARYIFNALTALSLIFALALYLMWVNDMRLRWYRARSDISRWEVSFGASGVDVARFAGWKGSNTNGWTRLSPDEHLVMLFDRFDGDWKVSHRVLGCILEHGRDHLIRRLEIVSNDDSNIIGAFQYWSVSTPGWPLVVIATTLPLFRVTALLLRRHRRRSLNRAGLCASCGYDLRATPERCPECGNVPTKVCRVRFSGRNRGHLEDRSAGGIVTRVPCLTLA